MSHSTTPQYLIFYWEMSCQQSLLRSPRQKRRSKFTTIFFWRSRYQLTHHLSWAPLTPRGKSVHNISKPCSGGDSSTAEIAENHWNALTFLNKLRRGIDRRGLVLLHRACSGTLDYKVLLCPSLYLTSGLPSWNSLGYSYQGLQVLATQLQWQGKVP